MTHLSTPTATTAPTDLSQERLRAMIRQAAMVRADVERFEHQFPELPSPQDRMPRFSWQEAERQLLSLTPHHMISLTNGWLSGTQKLANAKPPEMVLRELFYFANILQMDRLPAGWEDSMP